MREIDEILTTIVTEEPEDKWGDALVREVSSWPASEVPGKFAIVCNLVDECHDSGTPKSIAAHVLRQKLTAATVRIATLKLRLGTTEDGLRDIEFGWTNAWGDIQSWNKTATKDGEPDRDG